MSKFTQAECFVFLLYHQNTVGEYTSLTITDSLSWKSSVCISSKSFKHPFSVCAILTSQDRWYLPTTETMEPFVLQAGLGRGDSSLPQLAPNRAFVSIDWISEPLAKDTALLLKPYFPLSKLTQPFSSHWLQNEQEKDKSISEYIYKQCIHSLVRVQANPGGKTCKKKNSRMPTVLH